MKTNDQQTGLKAIRIFTLVYRYILGLFAIFMIAGLGSGMGVFAAEAGDFGAFNGFVCSMVLAIGGIVGGLAVIMIIAAGIMYALSGGSDKGAASISGAKTMITSALAGSALFLMGGLLFGECGQFAYGSLLNSLFPR